MGSERGRRTGLLSIALKLGIIASCCAGILPQGIDVSRGFTNSIFMAFTVQSNILATAVSLAFLASYLVNAPDKGVHPALQLLRFMSTSSVLLTWLAFAFLLSPMMSAKYLSSLSNICLHNIAPALALLDFVNSDRGFIIERRHVPLVAVMPILYSILFFAAYETGGKLPVGYFFLDYRRLGWFTFGPEGAGVAYWMAALLLVQLGLGAVAMRLRRSSEGKLLRTSIATGAAMAGISAAFGLLALLLRR